MSPKQPDLGGLMKQVQQMQGEMMKAQEALKDETVEASAGGGMVKVKMSGDLRLLALEISPDAIDPEDAEMLQDMVARRRQRGDPLGPGAGLGQDGRHHRRSRRPGRHPGLPGM